MIVSAPTDLERFLLALWRPGDVREVRIPTPGRTDSGYFDDPAALIAAVRPLDGRENVYLTVNPVQPALLARAANRIKPRSRTTTGDGQIVERRWLPIDIDPQRPSDISASEEEREAALEVTRQVWTYLNDRGWPEPVVAMSGNGYWMLYPLELPNDPASKALVDGVLAHLAEHFGTAAVSIDTTVSNASRIVALIGTLKVKGDATPDRPHRRSGLLRLPKELVPVSREMLLALAPVSTNGSRPIVVTGGPGDRMPAGWVTKLLDGVGVTYRTTERKGSLWHRLDRCPFHPDDDQGGDCGVGEDESGKALGHCFHNRGAGKTWQDFKAALGIEIGTAGIGPPRQPAHREVGAGIDAADLLALELPPLRWIVPDLIPEGTTILASPPKVGKSCFVYQIVVEATLGGEFLDRRVERGSALYLALEDGKRRGQTRLRAALDGRAMPRGFLEVRWDAPLIGQGLEESISAWLDVHPDAIIVAIDTLQKVRPQSTGKRGAYEVDVDDLGRLQTLFRDRRVALLVVHHARKDASDDFLASVSGTYGITGSADTIVVIKRKRIESFGQVYVTGRDVSDAEIPVRFDGMLWNSAPVSMAEASFERLEVFKIIEAEGPIFPAAVAEKTGLGRTSVQNMVAKLVEQGAVARTAGGYLSTARVELITDDSDDSTGARESSESSVSHRSPESPKEPAAGRLTNEQSTLNTTLDDDSDDSSPRARARTYPPDDSDDSDDSERGGVIGVTGDTRARPPAWVHPCREYAAHQSSHRQTNAGWTCDVCHPEETA